ncbi:MULTISPECIES: hypothetical protein [unclassified Mycobacterium]|uniref:hypothetical protein n=1 Tax=unclassified Mycobacterium TaxID=2642494 RepID=UPI0029C85C64|nr:MULTISPECIES: hypothetical protein [unclassified Mycobacterium]
MQHSMKTGAMLVAGAALVAAGAFVTALSDETAGPAAPTVLSSKMTLGETATTTTDVPSAPLTPVAEPVLKADVPCGFTSGC